MQPKVLLFHTSVMFCGAVCESLFAAERPLIRPFGHFSRKGEGEVEALIPKFFLLPLREKVARSAG